MKRATHTPGPWYSHNFGIYLHRESYLGKVGHSQLILDFRDGRYINKREATANIRLMAAAPELLEALREYVCDFGDATKARAAIAKATREQIRGER